MERGPATIRVTASLDAIAAAAAASSDGVILFDDESLVLYANAAARAIFGLERDDRPHGRRLVADSDVDAIDAAASSLKDVGYWSGRTTVRNLRTGEGTIVALSIWLLDTEPQADGTPGSTAALSVLRGTSQDRPTEFELADALEDLRTRAIEQRMIAGLNRTALTGRFDDLTTAALRAISTVVEARHAVIFRPPTPGSGLRLVAALDPEPFGDLVLPPGPTTFAGYALERGEVVSCPDARTETRFDNSSMVSFGLLGGVAVPITGGTEDIWGVLVVYDLAPRTFSPDEVSFLVTVAEVLASAVRRTELERELRYRSLHDPLTHLANRTLAYRRIDDALTRSRDDGSMTAVMLVDLHDFRAINDSFGHTAGDAVLGAVAPMLTRAVRSEDTVARFGGDEFLVVCPDLRNSFDATVLAQNVAAAFRRPLAVGEHSTSVSVCVGISVGYGEYTAAEMVRQADIAISGAKKDGPGSIEVYDRVQGGEAMRRLTIATELRVAIENGSLSLVYQPIVDTTDRRVVAVEALARWTSPTLGPVGPGEFVPAAERAGLIVPLGTWALRRACEDAVRWQHDRPIELRVNVSPLQLRRRGFVSDVARILSETGLPATRLGIEITESVWLEDTPTVRENLDVLHRSGVKVLLDDFGVGHSSLGYLTRFPILDAVKIDRSFVSELPREQSEAVIAAVVALSTAFDLEVVGEGVETEEQLRSLHRCGCRLVQGFLLARPMPAADFERIVASGGVLGAAESAAPITLE